MMNAFSSITSRLLVLQSLLTKPEPLHPTAATSVDVPTPIVTIGAGTITGTATVLSSGNVVSQFLGIPYAQSPPLRFSPPVAAPSFQSINATQWKSPCMQQFSYPNTTVLGNKARNFSIAVFDGQPVTTDSEDCLYLNIYVPNTATQNRAVMFWIFGGGLKFGHAGQDLYDGSYLANNQDVVVVTINYRTNVFGFPNSPVFDGDVAAHNIGFLDQRMALAWVQQNIEYFGGDKTKVTLFGQSAGAKSVDRIILNPPQGDSLPFHAAILQSDTATYNGPAINDHKAWHDLVKVTSCKRTDPGDELSCVRDLDATHIQDIIQKEDLDFAVWLDHITTLPTPVARNQTVPILVGTNGQESRVFTVDKNNLTAYVQLTQSKRSSTYQTCIANQYAVGSAPDLSNDNDALSQLATESNFQCATAYTCDNSTGEGKPTWRYYFNASFENTNFNQALSDRGFNTTDMYAFHTSEIAYVFGTLHPDSSEAQWHLSTVMQNAWAQFAKDPYQGPEGSEGDWPQSNSGVKLFGQHGAFAEDNILATSIDSRCSVWHDRYFTDGSSCPSSQSCPCHGS